MSTDQKNNEEEVDLGSLFKIIGQGFRNFFNFIGSIFKGIYHAVIIVLIFLRKHIVKIGVAGIIGFASGLFLEVKKTDAFTSDLLVNPNFKSARQLYNNINYYNDLVKQKDTLGLVETFKLDKISAASLKKFTIEPIKSENDIIDSYNDFVEEVDTTTVKSYEYVEFKNSFSDYDYKVHRINVIAEKNDVFKDLEKTIISSVVNNNFFNRAKVLTTENLDRTDSIYRQNITQLDSLRKVYMQVMIEEAKKLNSGTSIDLGGEKGITKELELFETNRKINKDLKDLVEEKSEKYEVINVISSFQPIGSEIKGITKNYAFLLALGGAGFMISIILLKQLNTYLNNYKK